METIWDEKNLIEQQQNGENKIANVHCDSTTETKIDSTKSDCNDTTTLKSGIYKIINKVNGKYYAGSTKNFNNRWRGHKRKLNRGVHKNPKLQSAWNKYGADAFELVIQEHVEPQRPLLLAKEQIYLDKAATEKDICYNLIFDATGGTLEQDSIEKIRQKAIGRKASDAARKKMSEKRHTEEFKQHLREILSGENGPFYGRKHTAEAKAKIGELTKQRYANAKNNPNYDDGLYHFVNDITQESFNGTRYEFCKKFNLNRTTIADLIYGRSTRTRTGWLLDASK